MRQHPHSSWSALECAAHISDVFQRSGVLLSRFLASESPDLDLDQVSLEAPRGLGERGAQETELASLGVASEHLSIRLAEVGRRVEGLAAIEEAVAGRRRLAAANPAASSPTGPPRSQGVVLMTGAQP